MKLPSKVTSYKESTISKFPIILKLLKEKDYTVSSLYTKIKNKISINDYVDVLICLYILNQITLKKKVKGTKRKKAIGT